MNSNRRPTLPALAWQVADVLAAGAEDLRTALTWAIWRWRQSGPRSSAGLFRRRGGVWNYLPARESEGK